MAGVGAFPAAPVKAKETDMSMKRIRLELARDHEFPEGSRERGYEFVAPLDERGHLVADEWRTMRDRCRVKLVHRRGGGWAFDYDPKRSDDDEPGFKLDRHHFIPGEYVSVTEHDGVMRTFRIIWIRDL
jgi:hypothetical protein